jgi:hypothetical protein
VSTDDDKPRVREERPTTVLDPRELTTVSSSWPLAVATLERLNNWAVLALRLGTLALLQECTRAMSQPNASPQLVMRARELVEALAHMPWEL